MRRSSRITAVFGGSLLLALASTRLIAGAGPTDQLPAEKQALEDFAKTHRDTGPKVDKSKDSGRPAALQTDPPPDTGLLGAVGAPIDGETFTATNEWAGWTSPTTYVQVYAGDSGDNPGRGLMFVVRRTGSGGRIDNAVTATTALITPPALGGPLRIVRVEGTDLVVVNPAGREVSFNPGSGAFN
jgi:hypothetical protein